MLNGDMHEHLANLEANVELFSMLKDLRTRQKNNPKNIELNKLLLKWEDFEKEELKNSGNLEYFAEQIVTELHLNTSKFFRMLHENSKYGKFEVDLEKMSAKELKDNLALVKQTFEELTWHINEEYDKIFKTHTFLREYKSFLPNFPNAAADSLNALEKMAKANQHIAKIHLLREIFEIEQA